MTLSTSKKPLVFVGLSGGVDSSVAAARLLNEGYKVVGVFIKVWQPDFLKCDSEAERLDAMRVAAHLKIPFLTLDAAEEYKREVGDYFINEYLAGRTPNPDVMCNRHVKFGAFWKFAKSHGADFIATGHYARVQKDDDGYRLLRGVDTNKDQSYFLWTLTQADLEHVLFPVGDSLKEVIRQEALKLGLPTAVKKDSQGICFLGHVDIKEFLSHFTSFESGEVLDEGGQVIGQHEGALIYTLGQRHGFTVFGEVGREPHYVVGKDIKANTITVSVRPPVFNSTEGITLQNFNSINGKDLKGQMDAQLRYRQSPFKVEIKQSGSELRVYPGSAIETPAVGQSMVFYDGDVCLGGGVVEG